MGINLGNVFLAPVFRMKQKLAFFLALTLLCNLSFTQNLPLKNPFTKQPVSVDWVKIKSQAAAAPHEDIRQNRKSLQRIQLPDAAGSLQGYYLFESPILSEDFAKAYPDIHTYVLRHVSNPKLSGRLMITQKYFHAVLLDGSQILQIRPDDLLNPKSYSIGTFDENEEQDTAEKFCGEMEELESDKKDKNSGNRVLKNLGAGFSNETRRTYNLAIVTTGEFHDGNGGTVAAATAVVVAAVNGIQAIYDRELSIRFNLLTPVIYTDYTTDPFDETSGTSRTLMAADAVGMNFASANYDIGHVFHDSNQAPDVFSGGGVAILGGVCRSNNTGVGVGRLKGRGWSGSSNNSSSGFIRLAAHEFGHMFGAPHTFNGTGSNCTSNISSNNGYEIGSGTTIMSYRGICGAQNVPSSGLDDDYFHSSSLENMYNFITTTGSCGVLTSTGNTAPVGNAGPTYTIPGETPFILTGTATDADGDNISYCWEQFDEDGPGTPTQGLIGAAAAANADAPLFRSFPPSNLPYRIFPEISNVLAGTNTGLDFEALPSVNRSMDFVLIVRDNHTNGGGIQCSGTTINVDASTGPFVINSQNTPTAWTADGTNTATINWDVAGTTGGSVNAANVDIFFSDDGGQSFPYTLVAGTPNDGSHNITIPNYPTFTGRIKVQASNNIFFDVNNADINITSSCFAQGASMSPDAQLTATRGDAALNLTLSPDFGTAITAFNGSLETSDPASNLTVDDNGTGCRTFGNQTVYDFYTFQVNEVDNYTFTRTTGASGTVLNLYRGFTPSMLCTNWLTSSALYNGSSVSLGSSLSSNLVPGIEYTLVVSSFSSTSPFLPAPYSITPSSAGTGAVYSDAPDPGASFSYTYVITNQGTGNITAIDSDADLSDPFTFTDGTYRIKGLSYLSTENLTPYVGNALTSLENDLTFLAICGNFSSNEKEVIINPSVFPVEFLDFDAKTTDGTTVVLNWSTALEINNDYFVIERKGEGEGEIFEAIGQVEGAGTIDQIRNYDFVDASPHGQKLWYRLKQVDFDGAISYSSIREVSLADIESAWTVYPNPAQSTISIVPTADLSDREHQISVYDLQGRLLIQAPLNGQNKVDLNIEHLPKALYIIQIKSKEDDVTMFKLMKE